MLRTNRILPAGVLLSCLLLSAGILSFSAGEESASNPSAGRLQGPILLSANPAYLSRTAQNDAPPPTPDATGEPVLEDPKEAEDAADEPEAEQPASEAATDQKVTRLPPVDKTADEPVEETAGEETSDKTTEDTAAEQSAETTEPEAPAPPKPKRQLSSAMAALRDRVRQTLDLHRRQMLNTGQHTATEIMHACLAFGCATEVYQGSSTRQKINGVTCLCWNYACAGYAPLLVSEGRIAGRIGYGFQEHPSQLMSVFALSRVPADYPIRVGEDVRTVADLVEHEKLSCRSGTDLSRKLIGLAYYAADEPTWQNSLGEQWSLERIIKEELAKPVLTAPDGGTHRLMGLAYAVYQRQKRDEPIEGRFARAREYLDKFHDYALAVQNSDGSWGPRFLAARGASRSQSVQLHSTGHVLRWLAVSLPEDRLEDPHVVRAVEYVNRLLNGARYRRQVKSLGTREIGSVMHALHALAVYDHRYFQPADPDELEETAVEPIKQASR